ncbi:MAG: plastocyanin/azurin family copper-binding protein, partial [Opitutae bacterium]
DSVKEDVLAHTKLLGPGESEVVKFKAPNKPGVHQFVCTFPGHYAMMRGIMVVSNLFNYLANKPKRFLCRTTPFLEKDNSLLLFDRLLSHFR